MDVILTILAPILVLFFFASLQNEKNSDTQQTIGSLGVVLTMLFGGFIAMFVWMALN